MNCKKERRTGGRCQFQDEMNIQPGEEQREGEQGQQNCRRSDAPARHGEQGQQQGQQDCGEQNRKHGWK